MRTISVWSWKGGSGKSTTALALATGLAQRVPKHRVLLADVDPQANATLIMLGGKTPDEPTLADVLLEQADATDAIRETRIARLEILPADVRVADCTAMLADVEVGRERRLSLALQSVEKRFDFCILDCAAQWNLLTLNCLQACTEVIVPIDPGLFAIAGLGRLQETVDKCRHYLQHPKLAIVSLLMTRVARNRVTRDLEKQLRAAYKTLVSRSVIPSSVAIEEAHASYRTIMEWAPRSPAAKAYGELVTEVLTHGRSKRHSRKRGGRPHAA